MTAQTGGILAVLNRPETAGSVVAATRLLGARMPGMATQLLHPRPDIDPDFMPTEELMTPARRHAFEAERDGMFRALCQAAAAAGLGQPMQLVGRVREVVAQAARGAAVAVAGPAGNAAHAEAKDAIEAILFDADAPLLLAPHTAPNTLGRSIAVAWERSEAADDALEAALPLLLDAQTVTVLVARERHGRTDLPAGLLASLRRSGHDLAVHEFDITGREIGEAILAEADAARADLLVMGAFTHNRTLEALFGGATREVMAGARIPVLLHH